MRVIQKYERDFNKIDTKDAETNCLGHSCLKNDLVNYIYSTDKDKGLTWQMTLHHDALTAGATVRNKITHLLQGKNYEKLIELESNIEVKLAGDKPIDPEYWDSLLVQLNVWKAKAKLKAKNEDTVKDAEDLREGFKIEMDPKPLKQLSNEDQKLDLLLPHEDWNKNY
ncbi:mid region of cactin-domain-containing protein [Phakopsora pachyrhizi]|uniref:Mid region of cactin-domain-containing protein n=1 Tax=Phakopsora pachyrhizi TaxID=170000 RepID=A0AAV0AXA8_PHAPC|nr:mid region of cactin-domain-containing protein [Phakopsora pachyrhizi]